MEFERTTAYELLDSARSFFVDGEMLYMGRLEISELKERSLAKDMPAFSEDEKVRIMLDVEASHRAVDLMSGVRNSMVGLLPRRGMLVRPEQYDEVKVVLRQMTQQVIEQYATTDEYKEEWIQGWSWDG